MPRRGLVSPSSTVFHVLNRGVRRWRLFEQPSDYQALLTCLREARERVPIRLLAYCLMPNHFHLVLWPYDDPQLSIFMQLMTGTHSKRWHAYRRTAGTGHVYQGRFKAFPVQNDRHFLVVCRYVEFNPVRAGLARRAEQWPWSSRFEDRTKRNAIDLDPWPIPQPPNWLEFVNSAPPKVELARLRKSASRGTPFGGHDWTRETAKRLGLATTLTPRGRPPRTLGTTP